MITFHSYRNKLSTRNKCYRLVWSIVSTLFFHSVRGGKCFNSWRIFLLRLFGAKIGKCVSVHASVEIWAPYNLEMEDYTLIGKKCRVYNPEKITLRTECVVSENVFLCTASHNVHSCKHELVCKPILLNSQVWVAADAFIGMGVTVGEGAIVGARACVFNDVDQWTVVGGNPAKFIKKREIKA